jgi:hypothetical protein
MKIHPYTLSIARPLLAAVLPVGNYVRVPFFGALFFSPRFFSAPFPP